jgi:hypothetical protein
MGFFSTRKTPTDHSNYIHEDRSVVQVIRSRFVSVMFYFLASHFPILVVRQSTKQKGKEREATLRPSQSFSHTHGHSSSTDRTPSSAKPLPNAPTASTSGSQLASGKADESTTAPRPSTDAISYVQLVIAVKFCTLSLL